MKPAMYIFINEGLEMSPGKIAAQAAHAAVEAYRLSLRPAASDSTDAHGQHSNLVNQWYKGGHYTKLVMSARDTEHLRSIQDYVTARGFNNYLVIDEGHTEILPITPTALGVEVVDRDDPHTSATFSAFKILRPKPTAQRKSLWGRLSPRNGLKG